MDAEKRYGNKIWRGALAHPELREVVGHYRSLAVCNEVSFTNGFGGVVAFFGFL